MAPDDLVRACGDSLTASEGRRSARIFRARSGRSHLARVTVPFTLMLAVIAIIAVRTAQRRLRPSSAAPLSSRPARRDRSSRRQPRPTGPGRRAAVPDAAAGPGVRVTLRSEGTSWSSGG